MQIAHIQKNSIYQTVKDSNMVLMHPSSSMQRKPTFVLYQDFVLTKKNYIRTILEIQPEWLL
jgi:pre-mRNA-splicing factor ATP-dependent RNA helicase DHX15/PRP43